MQNILLWRRAGTDAPYLHHRQYRDAPLRYRCIHRFSVMRMAAPERGVYAASRGVCKGAWPVQGARVLRERSAAREVREFDRHALAAVEEMEPSVDDRTPIDARQGAGVELELRFVA